MGFSQNNLSPSNLLMSGQFFNLEVSIQGRNYYLSFVYASNSIVERCGLWGELLRYVLQGPWLVIGDFNLVRGAHEKQGGIVNRTSCQDFNLFSGGANLIDLSIIGTQFTWSNGHRGVQNNQC